MIYSPLAIVRHLQVYLPKITNLFTNETSVDSTIVAGSPQTLRITLNNHGYSVGNNIVTVNGLLDNGINAVSQSTEPDGTKILRYTTNVNHDLTEDYTDNLTNGQIELRGFTDSQFNGFFDLYGVPSANTFEIVNDNIPTLNGNEVLRENRSIGVNDIFEITAIPDANTIDIELTGRPEFDIKDVFDLRVMNRLNSYRIDYCADWQRAQDKYTKQSDQDNLWLYVIMEDVLASKDRRIESDASQTNTYQNTQRIKNIGTFSINVIIPTKNDIGGGDAVQLSYETLYEIFLKVLSGVPFETFDNAKYVTTMISHGPVAYEKAYYAHNFTFEQVYEVVNEDMWTNNFYESVAFRRINISFAEEQDGSFLLLDEEA